MNRKIKSVHPGRILVDEFMKPARISSTRLARATGLSRAQIQSTIRGRWKVSAEISLRLEHALGMSAETPMRLQALYDLEKATLKRGKSIKRTTAWLELRDTSIEPA